MNARADTFGSTTVNAVIMGRNSVRGRVGFLEFQNSGQSGAKRNSAIAGLTVITHSRIGQVALMNAHEFEMEVRSAQADFSNALDGIFRGAMEKIDAAHAECQERLSRAKSSFLGEPMADTAEAPSKY